MTEQLIEIVKKYAFHCNTSQENHKNVGLKDKIWKKVGIEMNENSLYIKLIYY